MNILIKSNTLTLKEFVGEVGEFTLAEASGKKLTMRTFIEKDGRVDVKLIVYQNDIAVMATPLFRDAIVKYNALRLQPVVIAHPDGGIL